MTMNPNQEPGSVPSTSSAEYWNTLLQENPVLLANVVGQLIGSGDMTMTPELQAEIEGGGQVVMDAFLDGAAAAGYGNR